MVPLILVTSLFFLWAFGVNLNDILIPHLKKAFRLSDFRSSWIQVAFFWRIFPRGAASGLADGQDRLQTCWRTVVNAGVSTLECAMSSKPITEH